MIDPNIAGVASLISKIKSSKSIDDHILFLNSIAENTTKNSFEFDIKDSDITHAEIHDYEKLKSALTLMIKNNSTIQNFKISIDLSFYPSIFEGFIDGLKYNKKIINLTISIANSKDSYKPLIEYLKNDTKIVKLRIGTNDKSYKLSLLELEMFAEMLKTNKTILSFCYTLHHKDRKEGRQDCQDVEKQIMHALTLNYRNCIDNVKLVNDFDKKDAQTMQKILTIKDVERLKSQVDYFLESERVPLPKKSLLTMLAKLPSYSWTQFWPLNGITKNLSSTCFAILPSDVGTIIFKIIKYTIKPYDKAQGIINTNLNYIGL